MNKHQENNRARRICANLRSTLHTLKTNEERIAAIQFNEDLGAEEKVALIKHLQDSSKALHSRKNRLEARKSQLAFEDVDGTPTLAQPTHFLSHTEVIPDRASDEALWRQISRRQCKCARAFFTLQEAYAN